MKLTQKQKKFCENYVLNGYNATQAYIDAGYSCKKEKTARENASRLLATSANVKLYIAQLENQQNKEFIATKDDILKELGKMAFGNVGDLVDINNGRIVLKNDLDDSKKRRALASITNIGSSFSDGEKVSSKSFSISNKDKLKALELIAKMTGVLDGDTDKGNAKPAISTVLDTLRNLKK